MTERKRLSLKIKPKPDSDAVTVSESGATVSLGGKKKRIVIAKPVDLQNTSLFKPKKKKPKKPPSTLRLNALDVELGKLSKAWRSHRPLALDIEKQIFKVIADGRLSASKRVVRALLRKHCLNPNYLRNTVVGARYSLADTESGEVVVTEAAYALKKLRALTD